MKMGSIVLTEEEDDDFVMEASESLLEDPEGLAEEIAGNLVL